MDEYRINLYESNAECRTTLYRSHGEFRRDLYERSDGIPPRLLSRFLS